MLIAQLVVLVTFVLSVFAHMAQSFIGTKARPPSSQLTMIISALVYTLAFIAFVKAGAFSLLIG